MRRSRSGALLVAFGACLGLGACAARPSPASRRSDANEQALVRVATVHGGAGPWAVAGYRMGQHALARLGLEPYSFDLDVIHHTPPEVQYSCIADGAAASTGASVGKLNLTILEAADVTTVYRRKSTGQAVALRPTPAFTARFKDVPREGLAAAGRTVMTLLDAEVFEEVALSQGALK